MNNNPISGQGTGINSHKGDRFCTSIPNIPQESSAQPFSNVKQQYKKPSKLSVLFSMYEYVREHNKLMVDSSNPQKYKRVIQRLKQDGLIAKKGYGVWQVVKEFKQQYNTPKVTRNLRGHGFHWKLRLPQISNWHKRVDYLDSNKISYELKNKYQRIIFRHHKVWLCDESIIIYSPKNKSYFGESAKESQSLAIYNLEQLIIGLEHLLNCSFRIRNKYQVKISKQHYGKVKDVLAQQCNKERVKIQLNDKKRKVN